MQRENDKKGYGKKQESYKPVKKYVQKRMLDQYPYNRDYDEELEDYGQQD